MKQPHADLIHAWAEGAEIEYCEQGVWYVTNSPGWEAHGQYRIKDPYRELKEAAKDPTKQIRLRDFSWKDSGHDWSFNEATENYEIRDKPKEKQRVTLCAWVHQEDGVLIYRAEYFQVSANWKRAPNLDLIAEIEE